MIYLYLFLEFFKTGLFAIGGGMATIPFLYELARNRHWFTTSDLVNMIAISESTPGPVGINMATFVGYITKGPLGSVIATLSLVLPSYIIVVIIAGFLDKFKKNKYVQNAFLGLRPAVVGLLSTASLAIFKVTFFTIENGTIKEYISSIDYYAVGLFIFLFLAIMKWKKHPLIYIGAGAFAGIIINILKNM